MTFNLGFEEEMGFLQAKGGKEECELKLYWGNSKQLSITSLHGTEKKEQK